MSRALTIAIVTILLYYVLAQTPACLSGYTWSYNTLNQSPCDMAVALGGACTQTPFALQPLAPGFVYFGPPAVDANACRCSSVYYSLLSACAACQNHDFLNWSVYKVNCAVVYDQVFQNPIPPSIRIPHYAYLDVEVGDSFNVTLAKSAGGAESTAGPQPTGTSATATPTSAAKSSKSMAGPIAGGVIGGVVFVAILAGLIALIILRRRKKSASNPSTYNSVTSPETAMSYGNATYNTLVPTSMTPAKIYDPNDPSTFPINDPVGYNTHSYSPESNQNRVPVTPLLTGNGNIAVLSMPAGPAQAHYTGAPEL